MTTEIIAIIIISALIGFLIALGITNFSVVLTARLMIDNFRFLRMLSSAERTNFILVGILSEMTGKKYDTLKDIRKAYKNIKKTKGKKIERT